MHWGHVHHQFPNRYRRLAELSRWEGWRPLPAGAAKRSPCAPALADREPTFSCACLPSAVPATLPRLPRGLSTTGHATSRPRREVWGRVGARLLGLDVHGTLSGPAREAATS